MGKKLRYSKKVFIFFLILTLCHCCFAQNATTQESSIVVKDSEVSDIDESSILLNSSENQITQDSASGFSTFWLFFRMILILGIVVVCIYAVFWFMKKSVKGESDEDEPFLRKVSSVSLAPGKSVQIVTLVDKGFIVGVSEDSVNLISEINDKELIDAMNLYSDKKKQTQKPRSFADVLEIFMPRKKDTNIYDDSSKKFADMLNKQRDRLQDGE